MKIWPTLIAMAIAGTAFLAPDPVAAHQQKLTVTTVATNPRTGALEVAHQIPVHDAEHALRAEGAVAPDLVGNAESRNAFARYVAARFSVAANGTPVPLSLVGSEIEGGSIWVYQEAPAPIAGAELVVDSQILMDLWARQENRVNLGDGTDVSTLIFSAGSRPQSGYLP